jgi:hypothetical protein
MLMTLEEISLKYHISKRTLETNIKGLKELYQHSNKLIYNGQKWLVDTSLLKEITQREYAKNYIAFDEFKEVDEIDLKELIKERDLNTLITVAPRGITSKLKIKDIVRDVFDYYYNEHQNDNEPTFFIYSIESNSYYFKEKKDSTEKDLKQCFHIHAVTNAKFNPIQQKELTELLQGQINDYKIHDKHTVSVSPYVLGLGIGGLAYTLKHKEYTGAFIK